LEVEGELQNVEQLDLILVIIGFLVLLISLILIGNCLFGKNYKLLLGLFPTLIMSIGFLYVGFSNFSEAQAEDASIVETDSQLTDEETITEETNEAQETEKKETDKQEKGPNKEKAPSHSKLKVISDFKPTKQKYPIITYETPYSDYKHYMDADGTEYRNMTMINPDGVMMGYRSIDEAIVASQTDNPNGDEFLYYQGYHYYKGTYYSSVSEAIFQYPSENTTAPSYKNISSLRAEEVTGSEMSLYDFVYKFMPLQTPKEEKLVRVPLLDGKWEAYEDTIMNGPQLLVSMTFFEDQMMLMENNIVNPSEIPNSIYYKLEQLDENAYKLYLYEATLNEDGQATPAFEPSKRNFIIYVTSENTFELVYYNQSLKRISLTMNRV
jgi:hypothetical protein